MARAPILPSNPSDPTGTDRLVRGAMRDFDARMRKIAKAYIEGLNRIPAEPIVNKSYSFQVDQFLLTSILTMTSVEVDAQLLQGGPQNLWFYDLYVGVAYQRGTAQQFANLSQQSAAYGAGQQSVAAVLRSDPYRRRIALVAAREFEEMNGLSGEVKAMMSRVLTDGIGRGLNPLEIARNLTKQAGIASRRAAMIARTEIPTALRRARLDEADDAAERYGLKSKEMHISALSPTTRLTHAQRHATLHTTDEQREWWAKDANSINCKCGTTTVLVDSSGDPLVPGIVERAKRTKEVMREKGKGPWTEEEE